MTAFKRSIVLTALCAAFSVMILSGCSSGEAQDTPPTEARELPYVETLTIEATQSSSLVRATGRTAYKREAALGFGSPGEIMSIRVDEGETVQKGQIVATLRRINVGADVAEANLARQTAQNNYERMKTLHASGAVSDIALEDARLALERTRQTLTVTAPKPGVVLRRLVERGQIIGAGEPVVVIGEADGGVVANVSLNAAQMTRVALGDEVKVNVRERGDFKGVVSRISPVTSTSGVFPVEVAFESNVGLRSGEVVEVYISGDRDLSAKQSRLVVPAIALVDARADQGAVFVLGDDNIARRRAVETSGVEKDGVVINSGLAAGDLIVTRGASLLRDGDEVRVAAGLE